MNVIYSRVSPRPVKGKRKSQEEESLVDSIAVQLERCRAYAERNGLGTATQGGSRAADGSETLCEIEDRNESALSKPIFERPGGKELETLCESGKVKNIIIMKLDRMFRRVADGDYTLEYFAKKGITLHSVDEGGVIDTTTAFAFMSVCTRLMICQFEAMQTRERVKTAQNIRIDKGFLTGKHPPFGYKQDPGNPLRFIPCERSQETIRRILELHATGMGDYRIAGILRAEGHVNGHGKPIQRQTVLGVLKREGK